VSIQFPGARAVVEASKCALDREYSKKDHDTCAWCQHGPSEIIKAVWAWMKDPANGQQIAKEDRGEAELW
jgi:hypothetical protein